MTRKLGRTARGCSGIACAKVGLLIAFIAASVSPLSCSGDEGDGEGATVTCASDTECKGDRVCIDGRCDYPPASGTGAAGSESVTGARVVADNDANNDGMLSITEAPPDIQASFSQMDVNGDGLLTVAEIDSAGMSDAASSVLQTATQGASAAAEATSAFSGEICAEGNADAVRVAPKVVLLLDGSTSMEEPYANNTSKWSAMREALMDSRSGVVATMQGLIEFGLVIYSGPMMGGNCPIPGQVVGPAIDNYQAIAGAFPRNAPGVFTPTGQALQLVCEALPGTATDVRPQYVILATDGNPNSCNVPMDRMMEPPADYQSVIDAAELCCQKGVTIYVVSLASGGPEYEAHLQDVANIGACTGAGGAGTVYSPQDPGRLSADLGQLIGGAVTCEVYLNGSVTEGKECQGSVVTLNGRALDCNGADGWVLESESVIRMQGQACEEFSSNPDSVVTATFPCEIFIPGGGPGGPGSGGPGDGSAGSGSGDGTAGSGSGGPGDLGPIF